MKRLQSLLAKAVVLAAVGVGVSACVAAAPEPVPYYGPTYYSYGPGYYAPRPAYSTYYFYYEDRGRPSHRHHRGHRYRHWR
jgi:hypothetical protein